MRLETRRIVYMWGTRRYVRVFFWRFVLEVSIDYLEREALTEDTEPRA